MAREIYNNILQRLPAALILATFIFGIIYLQNIYLIFLLLFVVAFLLLNEWLAISNSPINLNQIIFFTTLVIFSIYFTEDFIDFYLFLTLIFWITYSIFLISNKTLSFISFNNNFLGIFLILSFLFALFHLMVFSELQNLNKFFVLFVILFNTVLADVGAYLVGSTFGKIPLFPNISPNKTLEGFLGGVVFVVLFVSIIYIFKLIPLDFLFISVLCIPFAFIGDYFESQMKRGGNIKDSSSLIPGHGGIWDRLDSHIAVVPIFICLINFIL